MRILIVDDDDTQTCLVETVLKEEYDISVCHSGKAALEAVFAGQSFDLILLDIQMPGINGLQVAQRLRRLPTCKSTPVIFLSAVYENYEEAEQFSSFFIDKPYCLSKLQNHIRLILQASA